ncbi:hypothetical protein [Novosphingobium sp. Fuku2-ISO-50]|uniref:hypothetical protein n=1 Tax=Novosphingobium sp. Fuku2-ISO-50 TaxID=1739114 RepID=UPI00076D45F7|nr:hypothetical protein [Novosphingobium sp. Fuku2-ISO-50]KUR73986.1 hypothetical protein AQZ50_18555 [Novosphingobium sp. Fuku2-ISO-50]
MAQGYIYTVDANGDLRRMTPSAPENEDRMQTLVAKYPELITDGDGDLLLVRREQTIADSENGGGRWSVDHLFVTRDAVPVLVELKRAVDTRLRREVVGQMLDYAANATAYWQAGRIAQSFAQSIQDPAINADEVLAEFIGDQEPESFWAQVDSNFASGRIKLVFVADEIPRELARIVEFLNDQMRADVRAVELRWFADEHGSISLSPRVIGETERTAAVKGARIAKPSLSIEEWLQKQISPSGADAMKGARAYIAMIEALGGKADLANAQGSIIAVFAGANGKFVYPLHLWGHDTNISLSLRWLKNAPALQDEAVRRVWFERLKEIVGDLSTSNLAGFPAFSVSVLANCEKSEQLQRFLADLVAVLQSRPV